MATVVVCAVVAAGTLALVAATDARPPDTGGAAAAFLPADGAVGWTAMPGGVAQYEHRRAPGAGALFVLPEVAAGIAITAYLDRAQSTPHWATYWGPEAGRPGANPRDLYSIGPDGIRTVANIGYAVDAVFAPGLRVLPSDVKAGAKWTSDGTSVWSQLAADGSSQSAELAYSAAFTAREPEADEFAGFSREGCLETVSDLSLTPAEGDALIYHQTSLWCPGEGQIASSGGLEGEEPTTVILARAPDLAVQLSARVPSWQHPESWDAAAVAARWSDPVWGDTAFTATPAVTPVMVGDALAVADVNSGDLTLLREDEQGLVVSRVLRPGGDVIALAAVGELLVAATSQRDLVAYTVRGDRVWTHRTPDLVVAAPVTDRGDGLVVACLDGTLRLLDAATGKERWSTEVSSDGVDSLTVTRDVVVSADRTGALAAVDLDDGEPLWTDESEGEVAGFATDGDSLYAARDDDIERLDAASGATVWKANVGTGTDDVVLAGAHVVAQTWDDIAAMDPETGRIVWRAPGAGAITTDGSSLMAASGARLRLIGKDGADAATWPVPPESLGSFRFLTPSVNAVWVIDGTTGIVKAGP